MNLQNMLFYLLIYLTPLVSCDARDLWFDIEDSEYILVSPKSSKLIATDCSRFLDKCRVYKIKANINLKSVNSVKKTFIIEGDVPLDDNEKNILLITKSSYRENTNILISKYEYSPRILSNIKLIIKDNNKAYSCRPSLPRYNYYMGLMKSLNSKKSHKVALKKIIDEGINAIPYMVEFMNDDEVYELPDLLFEQVGTFEGYFHTYPKTIGEASMFILNNITGISFTENHIGYKKSRKKLLRNWRVYRGRKFSASCMSKESNANTGASQISQRSK